MGFYYDEQLNNCAFTVRLYGGGDGEGKYEDEIIAKAIWTENFEFSTSNSWTNFESIGNAAESLWAKVKPFAGYASTAQNVLNDMRSKGQFERSSSDSKATQLMKGLGNWLSDNRNMTTIMNRSLIVQGTRFIYFGGSSVDMGNLMMKYTIMYDPAAPAGQRSVREQLAKLMPYCIGDFKNTKELAGGSSDGKGILSLIGWQSPPGGFEATWKNVDTQGRGTLKLVFGGDGIISGNSGHQEGDFEIDNLVVKDWNVSMSRVSVKGGVNRDPLYADVTLTFQLAGFITERKLRQYLKLPNNDSKFKTTSPIK